MKNWISSYRRLKPSPYLSLCTKLNSKWIKDLNERPDNLNLKLLEKNMNIGIGSSFLKKTPKE
jgi:hypothetical protein